MCSGPVTGRPAGRHYWKHFFRQENVCTGAGLSPTEAASELTPALRDQPGR